jgi:chorismate dehydratase
LAKLRISIVQYLNTVPLVWGFTHGPLRGKYELSFTVPSQCAEALRIGAADVAIIPAIEYARIDDLVVLPDLAIAAQGQVRSLLLIAKKPIREAGRIALDRCSRSTQGIVRILCADYWKIAPEFFEAAPDLGQMLSDADAALLIGDPALRVSIAVEGAGRGTSGELVCSGSAAGVPGVDSIYIYDLVEEWRRATGLPAVLAVWAARREVVTPELLQDFLASRDYGVSRIREISEAASKELGLPPAALERYLRENIDFSLSVENQRGLEHFFARAAALGSIPEAKTIEWAPMWENARAKA